VTRGAGRGGETERELEPLAPSLPLRPRVQWPPPTATATATRPPAPRPPRCPPPTAALLASTSRPVTRQAGTQQAVGSIWHRSPPSRSRSGDHAVSLDRQLAAGFAPSDQTGRVALADLCRPGLFGRSDHCVDLRTDLCGPSPANSAQTSRRCSRLERASGVVRGVDAAGNLDRLLRRPVAGQPGPGHPNDWSGTSGCGFRWIDLVGVPHRRGRPVPDRGHVHPAREPYPQLQPAVQAPRVRSSPARPTGPASPSSPIFTVVGRTAVRGAVLPRAHPAGPVPGCSAPSEGGWVRPLAIVITGVLFRPGPRRVAPAPWGWPPSVSSSRFIAYRTGRLGMNIFAHASFQTWWRSSPSLSTGTGVIKFDVLTSPARPAAHSARPVRAPTAPEVATLATMGPVRGRGPAGTNLVVILGVIVVALWQLHPSLLLANTTTAGGDTGAPRPSCPPS